MPPIWRQMVRCVVPECRRWWSLGPGVEALCSCGGELAPVDMQAHIASLPQRTATHNHPSTPARQPRGQCEACDAEYLAEDKARASKPTPT
jgi:hypothetical protein